MDSRIGELAGEVYEYLEENGETSVSRVSKSIDAPKA
ncbi:MAG: winged helix-turn-helix domain-containing protein, partial [Candidatus Nanohalobium sp.]